MAFRPPNLAIYNYFSVFFISLYKRGLCPKRWKAAILVLLEKPPKRAQEPVSYRPLCLLDTMASQ
ncbi:hypothetical protein TcasGA2_TC031167 [Tribolium castaneum]|uniref:Uncharacterized protein n=1 Tax=Tribolium castaneum TaxID=7070 RepID=A0A139W9Y4_TRICA|nr:hypothetical protein TcasGA2_TC031167 [Tribolium castaneum]